MNKKIIATHMSESARQYGNEIKNSKIIIPNDGDEFIIGKEKYNILMNYCFK